MVGFPNKKATFLGTLVLQISRQVKPPYSFLVNPYRRISHQICGSCIKSNTSHPCLSKKYEMRKSNKKTPIDSSSQSVKADKKVWHQWVNIIEHIHTFSNTSLSINHSFKKVRENNFERFTNTPHMLLLEASPMSNWEFHIFWKSFTTISHILPHKPKLFSWTLSLKISPAATQCIHSTCHSLNATKREHKWPKITALAECSKR